MNTCISALLPLALTVLTAATFAATPARADGGHRLLFSQAQGSLPEADQRAIYASFGLRVSPDGGGLLFNDLECPPMLFEEVVVSDLDGDGTDEVVLRGGNTCISGGNGSSIWLFVKSAQGQWQPHLGFPAGAYTVLAEKHQGFPDLQFGGMGWCESVWRWDGQTYQHLKNVPTQSGGCDHLP